MTGAPIRGNAIGMFQMPHSIALGQNKRIYVADYANGRIHIYEADGSFVGNFFDPPPSPEVAFQGPPNAEFDLDFNLWVTDFDAHRVFKYGPDLSFLGWIGGKPDGTVLDSFALTGESGRVSEIGGFFRPSMVQVDDSGFFYVVETGNHRVQKFSHDGHSVGWIGGRADDSITNGWETGIASATNKPGGFNAPVSLRLVDNSYFLIADNGNHRIQKFSLDGHFLGWLGGKPDSTTTKGWAVDGLSAEGSAPGFFSAPFDARLLNGKLYVADGHNGRVQIFELVD